MSMAAIGASVAGAAVAAGLAYATRPTFDQPNLAASGRRGVEADLRTLPGRRMLENAARLGTAVDYPTGRRIPIYPDGTHGTPSGEGGALDLLAVRYEPEMRHADFTGMGDADVASELARRSAELQLDLSRRYGDQFIDSARAQEEASDPLGTQARHLLYDEITKREEHRGETDRPVAKELDAQILEDLKTGRGLDTDQSAAVQDVLNRRGGTGSIGADEAGGTLETGIATGLSGEARLQQRLQHAMSYLGSGATPEDVDYRERQQSLADMASFLSGQTPTAQFRNLSGGQQGAAPQIQGPALPGPNPNAATLGQAGAVQSFNDRVRAQASTVSPWFAGLSALTRGAGSVVAANNPPPRA